MIYVTGDTHGQFDRIVEFCMQNKTTREDILIILGDAGFNYYGGRRDDLRKSIVSKLPITVFCIHGNHENRPENMPDKYKARFFCNGAVWVEEKYPNILFAMDGQVYTFNGLKTLVIGGAYSVDKYYRLENGFKWFADEQPDDKAKQFVETTLDFNGRMIDVFLTHTCPEKYLPVEVFLPGINQRLVDRSTEQWLDKIEESCQYKRWYCGHFHTDKVVDKTRFLFNSIVEFPN